MRGRARAEAKLFLRTLFRAGPLAAGSIATAVPLLLVAPFVLVFGAPGWLLVPLGFGALTWLASATASMNAYRFRHPHYRHLWAKIQDRKRRFEAAHRRSARVLKQTLSDTPASVERLVDAIYMAMLRADTVRHMLEELEPKDSPIRVGRVELPPRDAHARDLYTLAQKSREEYREHYHKLMSGVERTEAQAELLISSLDNLRLRLLDHRVTGARVEMPSGELIDNLTRHKEELSALEKAVEEVEREFVVGT